MSVTAISVPDVIRRAIGRSKGVEPRANFLDCVDLDELEARREPDRLEIDGEIPSDCSTSI